MCAAVRGVFITAAAGNAAIYRARSARVGERRKNERRLRRANNNENSG